MRGGFPEIRALHEPNRRDRYQSYLDSVIECDVAPIADVRKPDALRRFIDQLAARVSEEIHFSVLCKLLGIRKETIASYSDILSRLGLIHRLGTWTSSPARREIKAPKLHLMDTGLTTTLRGEDSSSFGIGTELSALGKIIENLVFIELEKSLPYQSKRWRLYHWREAQREINILAEAPGKLLALFEVKAASTVSAADFRHIDWFLTEGPARTYRGTGFVIYLGSNILSFGPRRIALPLSIFWSFRS